MKNRKLLGNLLLLLTALIWGTAFVAQRVGMDSIEPITFNAARMWLAAVAIGAVAILTRRNRQNNRQKRQMPKDSEKQINADGASGAVTGLGDPAQERRRNTLIGGICCGCFLTAASLFQQMGIVYTTAGKAGFITAMYMLLVPILNFVLFKKKNTWLVWTGVLIGVAGMYLLCITDGFSLTYGDTLVCICALLFSGHILCCDHFVRLGNPLFISAIQFTTVAVISSVAAFIAEEPSWQKVISAAIPILYCGIVSGGIGYTLQMIAQKFTDPTIASLLMSLESVFAVIAGALLLGERMTARELAGCIIMFAAIVLVQIPLPSRRR
ncbi:MAG: DMT family transporter [Lachnospiraceae bacterium]|nr:DMT family transporter [Lachnospiraceae bacterium]